MNKSNFLWLAAVLFLACPSTSFAQYTKHFEAGLRLGEPSSVSLKAYFDDQFALELSVGTSGYFLSERYDKAGTYKRGGIVGLLHFLVHNELSQINNVDWYYGGGVFFGQRSYYERGASGLSLKSNVAGISTALGIQYYLPSMPLTFFGEINPKFTITPNPAAGLGMALGGRFCF